MNKILLDTSILLIPGLELRDIFSYTPHEFELLIPSVCIEELKAMSKNKGKKGVAARVALKLIKQKNLKIIPSNHNNKVDDEILRLAEKLRIGIATLDRELKKRAKEKGIKVYDIFTGR